jgi:hypothetical protein
MPKKEKVAVRDLVQITSRIRPFCGFYGVVVGKIFLSDAVVGPRPPKISEDFWNIGLDVAVIKNPGVSDPAKFKFYPVTMYPIGDVVKKDSIII